MAAVCLFLCHPPALGNPPAQPHTVSFKPICGTNPAVVLSKSSLYGFSTGFVHDDTQRLHSVCAILTSMISGRRGGDILDSTRRTIHLFRWRLLFLCRSRSLHGIRKMRQTNPSTCSSRANHPPTTKANIRVCSRKLITLSCSFQSRDRPGCPARMPQL